MHRAGDRNLDSVALRRADHRTGDGIVLKPLAALHVLQRRGANRVDRRYFREACKGSFGVLGRHLRSLRSANLDGLEHQLQREPMAVWITKRFAQRAAAQRAHGVGAVVAHQLDPSNRLQVMRELSEDSPVAENLRKAQRARRLGVIELAELDISVAAVHQHSGRGNFRAYPGVAAHHGVAREDRAQGGLVLDSVLQRHDDAARREGSFQLPCRRNRVVGFDTKQDEVVGREVRRVLARRYGYSNFFVGTAHYETAGLDRRKMLTARAEVHILAGELQLGAIVSADTAGTHHQDLHSDSESSFDPGVSSNRFPTNHLSEPNVLVTVSGPVKMRASWVLCRSIPRCQSQENSKVGSTLSIGFCSSRPPDRATCESQSITACSTTSSVDRSFGAVLRDNLANTIWLTCRMNCSQVRIAPLAPGSRAVRSGGLDTQLRRGNSEGRVGGRNARIHGHLHENFANVLHGCAGIAGSPDVQGQFGLVAPGGQY